jgi:hypothetical protein
VVTAHDIFQFIGVLLTAGVVQWIARAIKKRREMPTTAVMTFQQATDLAVQRTEKDNVRLRAENGRLDAEKRSVDHRNDVLLDALREQVAYTKRQTQVIRELGGHIEDPPPLPPELLAQ